MPICEKCKEDRKEKDFLEEKICYKCRYDQKITEIKKRKGFLKCHICGDACEKGRWMYCSKVCAAIAEAKQKKSHWTAEVRSLRL